MDTISKLLSLLNNLDKFITGYIELRFYRLLILQNYFSCNEIINENTILKIISQHYKTYI